MKFTISEYDSPLELLEHLIYRTPAQKTLFIICSTREDFLDRLHPLLLGYEVPKVAEVPASQESVGEIEEINAAPTEHAFLSPTLYIIAKSKNIKLTYCPTVSHLRAHLSRCLFLNQISSTSTSIDNIVILNMIALHHGSSEFTLQGLTRTLAATASAANHLQSNLDLVECKDIHDPFNPDRGPSLWDVQVPLLNSSIKLKEEGSRWAGRTIKIEKIASRWFKDTRARPVTGSSAEATGGQESPEDEMLV